MIKIPYMKNTLALLLVLLLAFLLSSSVPALAWSFPAENHSNHAPVNKWHHADSNLSLTVKIEQGAVYARVDTDPNVPLPAIRLKAVNRYLLEQHGNDYVIFRDFDHDGTSEIGVLKSAGYGDANRCYSVFYYQQAFYSFSPATKKTLCLR